MKRFRGFIIKEFIHITRDYRTLIILIGMPVIQVLLFGFAITNEIKEAKIAVLDFSRDEITTDITHKILSNKYFKLYANLNSLSEVDEIFQAGKVKEVVIFEERFSENLLRSGSASVQLVADATDPNTGSTLINYTASIIRDYQNSLNEPLKQNFLINTEVRMRYNPNLEGVFLFVPGLITVILMLVSTMMTSISLTREKELGNMEVLLVSPMQPFQVILGKVVPYLFLAFFNAVIILALGYSVFNVPVKGSVVLLMIESIIFIITALSLGILISTRTASQQVALMVSLFGLMLPTIILSGFIFPVENMPKVLQVLSNIVPAKWFIIIVKGIMLKGLQFIDIWKETLILVGFTLGFIMVSIKNYKIRLD